MRKELWHKGTLVILAGMLVAAALVLVGGALLSNNAPVAVSDPVQYVNPFLGTAPSAAGNYAGASINSGNVFPGAVYPHGMVQWSPDTTGAPGGYRYLQHTIYGFSLTHFSGRGCSAYQDIPFMPTLGPLSVSPANSRTYGSSYSHSRESASPGYYSVHLDSTNIQVALTVTLRTGFGQFTYPSSTAATMLINTGGSATGDASHGTEVRILGSNQVVGSATSGNFCGGGNAYTVYFAAIFDHPFTGFGTWNGALLQPGERSSGGSHSGAYLTFDTTRAATVQVRVAISFVSIANAWLNLASENPGWNFDAVRSRVSAAWEQQLSRITIAGGTHDEQVSFYTALYHALIHPNVFSDVNGQYIGFDKRIHIAQGYTQYENFPGWDMYRSLIALLAILEPRETGDMLQSLVVDAQQGGGGLPRWEVANDNSGGMVGDSIDVVIATAYAFGARNFDTQAALAAMIEGATQPDTHSGKHVVREALSEYLAHGYVSTDTPGSASITLEYAVDDFAIVPSCSARSTGKRCSMPPAAISSRAIPTARFPPPSVQPQKTALWKGIARNIRGWCRTTCPIFSTQWAATRRS
jgi:predicted alpha-1,2-mannosidase